MCDTQTYSINMSEPPTKRQKYTPPCESKVLKTHKRPYNMISKIEEPTPIPQYDNMNVLTNTHKVNVP